MRNFILILTIFFLSHDASAQAFSYTDPAAAYQRLLLETNDKSVYRQIGTYKVIGTPYLFGPKLKGDFHTKDQHALATELSYNTYSQEVEAYNPGQELPITFKPIEIDSFTLYSSLKVGIDEDLVFLNSRLLDPAAKPFFLQLVAPGVRYALFKAYKSELGYVSTNYVQSDLRQFDLVYDYYYIDATKKGYKKLKLTPNALQKEFKGITDISPFTNSEDFVRFPEKQLKKIFAALNLHP